MYGALECGVAYLHVVCRRFAICCVLAVIVGGVQVSVDPAGVLILAPRLSCSVIAPGNEAHPLPCEPAHSSAAATWLSTPHRGLPLRALRSGHGHTTPSTALISWQGCTVVNGDVAEDGYACIAVRGGCSFDAKVAIAKQLQCSALLIVDNAERELQPPGLRNAAAATMPVAMIRLLDGKDLFNTLDGKDRLRGQARVRLIAGAEQHSGLPLVPPPPMASLSPRSLSWRPRVIMHPALFSAAECDYVVDLARQQPLFNDAKVFNSVYFDPQQQVADAILASIESRLAAITGSPEHNDEEPMCVHRILPSRQPRNIDEVHHDKVNKEFSSVTVIVYLNNVEAGGETIWPCAGTIGERSATQHCRKAFDAGARWFDGQRTVVHGMMGQHHGPTAAHASLVELLALTHDGCVDDATWGPLNTTATITRPRRSGFVKARPRKGDAVVFWHNTLNGTPDSLAWHTGCRVRQGVKWTLQKFKELPVDFR